MKIYVNGVCTCIERLNSRGKWVSMLFTDNWEDAVLCAMENGYAVRELINDKVCKEFYP